MRPFIFVKGGELDPNKKALHRLARKSTTVVDLARLVLFILFIAAAVAGEDNWGWSFLGLFYVLHMYSYVMTSIRTGQW